MSALEEPNIRTALIPLKNAVKALDAEKLETRRVVGMLQHAQEDAKRHAEENADLILQMRRITNTEARPTVERSHALLSSATDSDPHAGTRLVKFTARRGALVNHRGPHVTALKAMRRAPWRSLRNVAQSAVVAAWTSRCAVTVRPSEVRVSSESRAGQSVNRLEKSLYCSPRSLTSQPSARSRAAKVFSTGAAPSGTVNVKSTDGAPPCPHWMDAATVPMGGAETAPVWTTVLWIRCPGVRADASASSALRAGSVIRAAPTPSAPRATAPTSTVASIDTWR